MFPTRTRRTAGWALATATAGAVFPPSLAAVDDVARQNPVDRARLYVVGHSNGGTLAYCIAAERPEVVAAVAAVSATIGRIPAANEPEWTVQRPTHPAPVLALRGRADEDDPYEGGRAEKGRGKSATIFVTHSVGPWVDVVPMRRSERPTASATRWAPSRKANHVFGSSGAVPESGM